MLVRSDVDRDARVQREATALVQAGHDVTVLALAGASAAYQVIPVAAESPFPGGGIAARGRFRGLRNAARWTLLPQHELALRRSFAAAAAGAAAALPFDVVHAHDFETLALGATLAAQRGARLVYDSHEVWSGRQRRARPAPVQRRRELAAEQRLGACADAVVTVGEDLAAWMRRRFGWNHVTVVRNSFPLLPPAVLPGRPRGLLYAGRIAAGRDLDAVAAAARGLRLPVVLMGTQDPATAVRLGSLPGVEVRDPVAVEDVVARYRELGIGLATAAPGPLNHRLSMPNKLFQAVQAGVPVVATDLPSQARVVRETGIGELYRGGDARSFAAAVERLLARWSEAADSVRRAAPALSWEVDAERLTRLYDALASVEGSAGRGASSA